MERTINLEDILSITARKYASNNIHSEFDMHEVAVILASMKEACRQTLELAAENAKTEDYYKEFDVMNPDVRIRVKKQSISDTINQVI